MSYWPMTTLGRTAVPRGLVGGPFGSSLVGNDYKRQGVPVIRGANLTGRSISGEYVFVSSEKVAADLSRNVAEPGDLVFTQRGTLGQVAIVPADDYPRYVVSQSQMRLRVNTEIADPSFIYYACTTSGFVNQVKDNTIATGVPHINLGILARLDVPLPPRQDQLAIAQVLGALDDKIATNGRVIHGCEELSRTIFESMLVDPEMLPLSHIARFINGKAFTKNATGSGRVVIRIAELNSGLGGSTVYNDIDVDDHHLARPGDLLFAWSGSLTLHRWFRPEGIINQHIFKVLPSDGYPMWLVHGALGRKLAEFKGIAADKATTMGHIQRHHLDEPVEVPSAAQVKEHDVLMTSLWNRALAAEQESLSLAAIRDALLPPLMSGTLHVTDAERAVGEVI